MNLEPGKLIYTLGTSTRVMDEFIQLLTSHSVGVVIDVRRFPWRCHRRFIALELEKQGWQVSHIIDKGRDWAPRKRSANAKQLKLT